MLPPIAAPPFASAAPPDLLRTKAAQLETAFLTVMLGQAGLDAAAGAFSGGAGEAQFASFLREQQAAAMVEAGGIGLTESIHRAMEGEG